MFLTALPEFRLVCNGPQFGRLASYHRFHAVLLSLHRTDNLGLSFSLKDLLDGG